MTPCTIPLSYISIVKHISTLKSHLKHISTLKSRFSEIYTDFSKISRKIVNCRVKIKFEKGIFITFLTHSCVARERILPNIVE